MDPDEVYQDYTRRLTALIGRSIEMKWEISRVRRSERTAAIANEILSARADQSKPTGFSEKPAILSWWFPCLSYPDKKFSVKEKHTDTTLSLPKPEAGEKWEDLPGHLLDGCDVSRRPFLISRCCELLSPFAGFGHADHFLRLVNPILCAIRDDDVTDCYCETIGCEPGAEVLIGYNVRGLDPSFLKKERKRDWVRLCSAFLLALVCQSRQPASWPEIDRVKRCAVRIGNSSRSAPSQSSFEPLVSSREAAILLAHGKLKGNSVSLAQALEHFCAAFARTCSGLDAASAVDAFLSWVALRDPQYKANPADRLTVINFIERFIHESSSRDPGGDEFRFWISVALLAQVRAVVHLIGSGGDVDENIEALRNALKNSGDGGAVDWVREKETPVTDIGIFLRHYALTFACLADRNPEPLKEVIAAWDQGLDPPGQPNSASPPDRAPISSLVKTLAVAARIVRQATAESNAPEKRNDRKWLRSWHSSIFQKEDGCLTMLLDSTGSGRRKEALKACHRLPCLPVSAFHHDHE